MMNNKHISKAKKSPPYLIIVSGLALIRLKKKENEGNVAGRNLGKAAFLVCSLTRTFCPICTTQPKILNA